MSEQHSGPRITLAKNPIVPGHSLVDGIYPVGHWRHKISATLGFETAEFDITGPKDLLEELYVLSLGHRVTRYGPDGHFVIWDGQLVEMTLVEPAMRQMISLREMWNRVQTRYIPMDPSANPPTEGVETSTAIADDPASQGKYGIKHLIFRPPKISRWETSVANQQRDVLLARYREPRRSDQAVSGSGQPVLHCTCEGYGHTLGWRPYNQTTTSGKSNANTVIQNVITAVGQFIAQTDLTLNPTQVQNYFNRDHTALEILQAIAGLGDSNHNRWLAYVLEDRILRYKPASTTVKYERRLSDPEQKIYDVNSGLSIPFWEIRPNHWLRTTDLFPLHPRPANLDGDFQTMFIEAVDWQEPDRLVLTGSLGEEVQVMIARAANQGDALL